MSKNYSELNQYFHFLSETLGVKQLYIGAAANKKNELEQTSSQKWIYIENLSSYNEQEKDLLRKMVAALGLKPDEYQLTDQLQGFILISFVDNPQDHNQTYSPRTLLLKPELKKTTWEDMKRIVLTPN